MRWQGGISNRELMQTAAIHKMSKKSHTLTKIIFDLKEPAYLLSSVPGHQTILGDIVACL